MLIGFITFTTTSAVKSQSPIIRAIIFYSPSCGHCQKVLTEDLPPLLEEFPEQLIVIGVDVSNPEGQRLYQIAVEHHNLPDDQLGVPMLIVGNHVLIGAKEIPEQFPKIISSGLREGGIEWPDIPEIKDVIKEQLPPDYETGENNLKNDDNEISTDGNNSEDLAEIAPEKNMDDGDNQVNDLVESSNSENSLVDKFNNDTAGNSIAVVVLFGMLAGVGYAGYVFVSDNDHSIPFLPDWLIPVLSILGLFVAVYLTFIETTNTEAVCGPVGDCNTVQQSKYAQLFGFLPVGLIGVVGYIIIIGTWIIKKVSKSEKVRYYSSLLIWILAWFGVLFSIYLTFLEPFVIGATCMWCITSAILMMLVLLASTPDAKSAFNAEID